MLVFRIADKTDLNQISLTGVRSLLLLSSLMKNPMSLDEIKAKFIEYGIMEQSHSNDIIRIDLNTLRTMGCEITRASAKTGYKYVLLKHPFSFDITPEEMSLFKKVYKKIKDRANIKTLIEYDTLFKKLASHVTDNDIKEELYGISALKYFNIDFVNELDNDCTENKILKLIYQKPDMEESEKEVLAQKIVFQNDKIYLYGFDIAKREAVVLNIARIKSIISRMLNDGGIEVKTTHIKFFLKNSDISVLEDGETIVEQQDNGCIVEGKYHNEFVAAQRILSFGPNCTVLEPQEFREMIIRKLLEMRTNYNG